MPKQKAGPKIFDLIPVLESSLQAEEDAEKGYHLLLTQGIDDLIKVEDTVAERLKKMLATTSDPDLKLVLPLVLQDTRDHAAKLRQIRETLDRIESDEVLHALTFKTILDKHRKPKA